MRRHPTETEPSLEQTWRFNMKMVKSLLLGSAAGLVAVAGAQAADLPVKAKAVEYVKVCSLYGAGFYYIPGTDTCIKIGGYVRYEAYHNEPAGALPRRRHAQPRRLAYTRHTDTWSQQARSRHVDATFARRPNTARCVPTRPTAPTSSTSPAKRRPPRRRLPATLRRDGARVHPVRGLHLRSVRIPSSPSITARLTASSRPPSVPARVRPA